MKKLWITLLLAVLAGPVAAAEVWAPYSPRAGSAQAVFTESTEGPPSSELWLPGTVYALGDTVVYLGRPYVSLRNNNRTLPEAGADWSIVGVELSGIASVTVTVCAMDSGAQITDPGSLVFYHLDPIVGEWALADVAATLPSEDARCIAASGASKSVGVAIDSSRGYLAVYPRGLVTTTAGPVKVTMGAVSRQGTVLGVTAWDNSWVPATPLPPATCAQGAVASACLCGGAVASTGYCCAGTWSASACVDPETPAPAAGTPQALYSAAREACEAMPLRATGTIHYYCDCQTGSEAGCTAGDDARADATTNASDCSNPALPCRTIAAAQATFNRMPAGDTIAFCKGGVFEQSGSLQWNNAQCAPTVDPRAAGNTTTCDIRDYTAAWGGSGKPILKQTAASQDLFRFWNTWTNGVRVLNLAFEGGGGGCGGAIVGRAVFEGAQANNVFVCGNTLNRWYLGANLDATAEPVSSGWTFEGNAFYRSGLDAILGSGDNLTINANYFEDNGSCTGFTHTIYPAGGYISTIEVSDYKITNNWIKFANTTCSGPVINGHGSYDGVLIENNFIDAAGHSTSSCWGIGMAPDSGYTAVTQYERNMVIRNNRVESAGWHHISCASCPDVRVENNVLISTTGAAPNSPLIAIPAQPARAAQSDPITTRAIIRHNTIYLSNASTAISVPNHTATWGSAGEGTGYVIANNAIHAADSNAFCWRTQAPDSAYTLANNACSGGTWDNTPASSPLTANPLFASVPFNLIPQLSSPLLGAGLPAQATTYDFAGLLRSSPPAIGAYEYAPTVVTETAPTFTPGAGTYAGAQSIAGSCGAGATLCYTTDGSAPAAATPGTCSAGTAYSTLISIPSTTTIRGLCTKAGSLNSGIASAAYTIGTPTQHSDAFTGAVATLPAHDAAWGDVATTLGEGLAANAALDGSGVVWAPTDGHAGGRYMTSASDISQITLKAQSGTDLLVRGVVVRADGSSNYYDFMVGSSDGVNLGVGGIEKHGGGGGGVAVNWLLFDPFPVDVDHVVRLVATSGAGTLALAAYVDGVQVATWTDTSPLAAGSPGWRVYTFGHQTDSRFDAWQDY